MQSSKEQQGEIRKSSSVINAKKQRKTTESERLEISSRKLELESVLTNSGPFHGPEVSSPSNDDNHPSLINLIGKKSSLKLKVFGKTMQYKCKDFDFLLLIGVNGLPQGPGASLVAQTIKNLPATQATCVWKVPWRREQLLTPVFLPGEFHEQKRLVGYSPQGRKDWDMTKRLTLWLSEILSACWQACQSWITKTSGFVAVRHHTEVTISSKKMFQKLE